MAMCCLELTDIVLDSGCLMSLLYAMCGAKFVTNGASDEEPLYLDVPPIKDPSIDLMLKSAPQ
eukprot:2206508-Rhodomonas_salina.1